MVCLLFALDDFFLNDLFKQGKGKIPDCLKFGQKNTRYV